MSSRRSRFACLLVACALTVVLGAEASAWAQGSDGAFERCRRLYSSNDFDGAYLCYKSLWDTKKGPDVAANLGNVEVQLGKYTDAYLHLQYVLETYPISDPQHATVMQKTREKQAEAKRHIAVFKLDVTPAGASVAINGAVIGTTPLSEPIALDPGTHQLTATLNGYTTLAQPLTAVANTEQALNFDLTPDRSGGTPNTKRGVSAAFIAVAISGGVLALGAIGAGVGLHVTAAGKADDREALATAVGNNSACSDPNLDPRCGQIRSLADEETTLSVAGTAMLIVGGVLAAGTIVTVIVWPSARQTSGFVVGPQSLAASQPRLWVAPSLAGLSAGGSF